MAQPHGDRVWIGIRKKVTKEKFPRELASTRELASKNT